MSKTPITEEDRRPFLPPQVKAAFDRFLQTELAVHVARGTVRIDEAYADVLWELGRSTLGALMPTHRRRFEDEAEWDHAAKKLSHVLPRSVHRVSREVSHTWDVLYRFDCTGLYPPFQHEVTHYFAVAKDDYGWRIQGVWWIGEGGRPPIPVWKTSMPFPDDYYWYLDPRAEVRPIVLEPGITPSYEHATCELSVMTPYDGKVWLKTPGEMNRGPDAFSAPLRPEVDAWLARHADLAKPIALCCYEVDRDELNELLERLNVGPTQIRQRAVAAAFKRVEALLSAE